MFTFVYAYNNSIFIRVKATDIGNAYRKLSEKIVIALIENIHLPSCKDFNLVMQYKEEEVNT